MQLVAATNNKNKIKEIRQLLPIELELLTLSEINCHEEIPETSDTIAGNAILKAEHVYKIYGKNCFADDTGLMIDSLNGEPGVYSARYAGEQKDANDNMDLVLAKLHDKDERSAKFITVIALIIDGETHLFEGIVEGVITDSKSGKDGFGYDPIFRPNGESRTFSEMSLEEKNNISHRGKAVRKLTDFLSGHFNHLRQ